MFQNHFIYKSAFSFLNKKGKRGFSCASERNGDCSWEIHVTSNFCAEIAAVKELGLVTVLGVYRFIHAAILFSSTSDMDANGGLNPREL